MATTGSVALASEEDWRLLRDSAHQCLQYLAPIIGAHRTSTHHDNDDLLESLKSMEKAGAQIWFLYGKRVPLTKLHYEALKTSMDELWSWTSAFATTKEIGTPEAAQEVCAHFEDWGYKFDCCWFLIGLYFRDDPLEEQNDHPVVQLLQRQTQRLHLDFEPNGDVRELVSNMQGTLNSTVRFKFEGTGHERRFVVMDGHTLIVSGNVSTTNPSLEARTLVSKLSMASEFAPSLMNSVACLEPTQAANPSTPLIFETNDKRGGVATLRTLLHNGEAYRTWSRDAQVSIALDLAKAIHGLHICDIRHGNITSDCVLIVEDDEKPKGPKEPEALLYGFQCIPSDKLAYTALGRFNAIPDLFRYHNNPDQPEWTSMLNDIRNLGICLLEIAFFNSFVAYDRTTDTEGEPWAIRAFVLPQIRAGQSQPDSEPHLINMADEVSDLGDKYSEAAKACFTLGNGVPTGDTLAHRINLSLLFIDNVLLKLHGLSDDEIWAQSE